MDGIREPVAGST